MKTTCTDGLGDKTACKAIERLAKGSPLGVNGDVTIAMKGPFLYGVSNVQVA